MPSSTLRSVGSLAVAAILSPVAASSFNDYSLVEAWHGETFIEHFNFFSGSDPTNGYTTYLNESSAYDSGLFNITSTGSIFLGVDSSKTLDPNGAGRDSVRIESKKYYDKGLFIADIQHMPGSICGIWPAFWTVGGSWPEDGEIDILEGVNKHEFNEIVMHTSGTCKITNNDMSGTLTSSECGDASGTIGCVVDGANGTYGTPFNRQGGGVYAMEWTSDFIKIWFFPRGSIPASITKDKPDTSAFGKPMANVQGECDVAERFKSQHFIFDTTFCGDWAGGVFGDSGCPLSDSSSGIKSCVDYVAKNPTAFQEAYWEINSFKIYETGQSSKSWPSSTVIPVPPVDSATATAVISTWSTHSANAPAETPLAADTSVVESTAAAPETSAVESTSVLAVPVQSTVIETSVTEIPLAQTSVVEAQPTTTAPAAANAPSVTDAADTEAPSTITSYVTSKTTICPIAEASSSAAAALGAAQTDPVPASAPTTEAPTSSRSPIGHIVDIPATEPVVSSAAPASATHVAAGSEAANTPASANDGPSVPTTPASAPETATEPAAESTSVVQPQPAASAAPVSSDLPEPSVPAPVVSTAAVPSDASPSRGSAPAGSVAPVSSASSSKLIPAATRAASSASVDATHAPNAASQSGDSANGASGSSTSTVQAAPVFTGSANKLSVVMSAIFGAVAVVMLA